MNAMKFSPTYAPDGRRKLDSNLTRAYLRSRRVEKSITSKGRRSTRARKKQ